MKKLATSLLALAVAAALMPAVAHATETTTGSDSVDPIEPPTECIVYVPEVGPARTVHGKIDTKYITALLPECEDVEGICVEVVWPDGPARIAHRPATETTAEVPCVPIDPACDFAYEFPVPRGQARTVHQSSRPAGDPIEYLTVPIPEECQEALSEALVPAGSDSNTIVWVAALFVGLGGAMVVTRRAVAIRTR